MDPAHARELLARGRTRIEGELAARELQGRLASSDRREPGDEGSENLYEDELDPENLGSDLYQDELDEGLRDDLEARLAAVERAEERLAAGTYGLSVESGKPIPDERLEVLPTAERTVEEDERYRRPA